MCRSLPVQPNFEDIKQEARQLLHDLRRRNAAALERYHSLDPLADMFQPRLADAQYMIARQYGYRSWPKLQEYVVACNETQSANLVLCSSC